MFGESYPAGGLRSVQAQSSAVWAWKSCHSRISRVTAYKVQSGRTCFAGASRVLPCTRFERRRLVSAIPKAGHQKSCKRVLLLRLA